MELNTWINECTISQSEALQSYPWMIWKDFLKKLLSNTFHFAYAIIQKILRAAYATFPPPSFRLRMTYAWLTHRLRAPGFSKTVPNALRGSLRTAYATLPPAVFPSAQERKCLRHACALLARPSARHVFKMCSNILLTRRFRQTPCLFFLTRCLRHACVLLTRDDRHPIFWNRSDR